MMKVDLLTDEEKSRLQLFINSDVKDVLRYENSKHRSATDNSLLEGYQELAKICSTAGRCIPDIYDFNLQNKLTIIAQEKV